MPVAVYESSPIKRSRRTKSDVFSLRQAIYNVVSEDRPMTVRQVFYRLVSAGLIDKTEAAYKMVVRLLGVMRREGQLPFSWIADSTRWQRVPQTYSSLDDALEDMQTYYRRNLWDNQNAYVEIWLEKEMLAGVIYQASAKWHVPLMVTRGYPSLSYLATAAETMQAQDRPCYLYYFGDLDPSGVDIPADRIRPTRVCPRCRHSFSPGCRHSRASRGNGPTDEAHQDYGHPLQELQGRIRGGGRHPAGQTPRDGDGVDPGPYRQRST